MRGEGGQDLPGLPVAYRGYLLRVVRRGTPTETVHIRQHGEFISAVPTIDKAKEVIDEWMTPR
jgi:hypothetical protein